MIGQYSLYTLWAELRQFAVNYRERPFFLDWHLKEPSLFHCNFENVDAARYPSVRDEHHDPTFKRRVAEFRDKQDEDE